MISKILLAKNCKTICTATLFSKLVIKFGFNKDANFSNQKMCENSHVVITLTPGRYP
jgi:hypothetical protein